MPCNAGLDVFRVRYVSIQKTEVCLSESCSPDGLMIERESAFDLAKSYLAESSGLTSYMKAIFMTQKTHGKGYSKGSSSSR